MRKLTAVPILCLALAAPLAAQTAPGAPGDVPILTVSGWGQSHAAPDEATVRLGILAQAATAREAQDRVNRTAGAILEAIRKLGIPAERIQTSGLNLGPQYAQARAESAPKITGYQASSSVSVRIDDLAKVGPAIDAGLAAGANNLDGVEFGLRDDGAARAAALTDAVRSARGKAEALAAALRVRLVEIVEVAEGGAAIAQPQPFRGRAMAMSADTAATPVSPGQVGVDASVTVRWRIAPCSGDAPCK